jgi:hypothetical protein
VTTQRKGDRWPLGIVGQPQSRADMIAGARFAYLCVLAEIRPDVLTTLSGVRGDDLTDWARGWHLDVDWALSYARATLEEWVSYPTLTGTAWFDDEGSGGWSAEVPLLRGNRAYREPRHFSWLARCQMGERYQAIARSPWWLGWRAGERLLDDSWRPGEWERHEDAEVTKDSVKEACLGLASSIGLPLRSPTPGRPKRFTS